MNVVFKKASKILLLILSSYGTNIFLNIHYLLTSIDPNDFSKFATLLLSIIIICYMPYE